MTGEVVIPKKRYVEELFNTFDVDQDQSISFHEYLLRYSVIDFSSMSTSNCQDGSNTLMEFSMMKKYPELSWKRSEKDLERS